MNKVTKIFIAHNNCNTILNEISNSLLDSTKQENFEIILVDNGSTDGTYQHIMRCDPKRKIRYVRFKNKVDYNIARAKGMELATSEFVELYSLNKNYENQAISLGIYWNGTSGDELEFVINLLNSVLDNIRITVYHNKNNPVLCSNVNEVITDDEQEIPYLCLKRSDDILLFSYKNCNKNMWGFLYAVFKAKIPAICYWDDKKCEIDSSRFTFIKNNKLMETICSNIMQKEWLNSQMYDYRSVMIDSICNSTDDDLSRIIFMWYNELVKLKRIKSNIEKFATCTVDGISYVATSNDASILPYMKHTGCNFSKENIDIFYYLANKYYNIKNRQGFFLDIGANIGTTSVYFKKNLDHNVNLIAFEPGKMNYKLLRTNYILNDVEEGSRIENVGLGNAKGTSIFHTCEFNPGASSVVLDYSSGNKDEVIQITTLDDYLFESGINADDIKYIWIDVEGMEPLVIEGAMKTLRKNPVPIHMEFSPYLWNDINNFNEIVSNLQIIYSKFMYISEVVNGKEITYDIRELYKRKNDQFGVIDDIFLIP